MALANLGSISTRIFNLIDNIPTSISGAELNAIVYDNVIYMEAYTGLSIGSVNIAERFQPALVMLSAGATQRFIEGQGADQSFTLGDFSSQAANFSNSASNAFTNDGMEKLKRIGRQMPYYKAWG